ncbi:helix-turn-helix domain-containing protein [Siminovitchia sediminis]|uniref:Helix-turn-helix domain-containing protein n=1 Tax=Siminovitchia sediminis TaxID=1274353 RepID=A0ABW4KLA0_9BACI
MPNLKEAIKQHYKSQKPAYAPIQRTTLTVKEVSAYLDISTDFVYKLVREKQIPHVKIGSRILFKKTSIERWLNEIEFSP